MSVLLRVLPLVAAVAGLLLPAGAQVPVKGGEVSDFDFAVDVVERAYAGYPDKTPLPSISAGSTIRTSERRA